MLSLCGLSSGCNFLLGLRACSESLCRFDFAIADPISLCCKHRSSTKQKSYSVLKMNGVRRSIKKKSIEWANKQRNPNAFLIFSFFLSQYLFLFSQKFLLFQSIGEWIFCAQHFFLSRLFIRFEFADNTHFTRGQYNSKNENYIQKSKSNWMKSGEEKILNRNEYGVFRRN